MQAHARSPSAHGAAALVALAVIAAGCAKLCSQAGLGGAVAGGGVQEFTDHIVREAACLTVTQLAQFLQPDILRHAPTILPRLLEARRRPAAPPAPPPRPPIARGGGDVIALMQRLKLIFSLTSSRESGHVSENFAVCLSDNTAAAAAAAAPFRRFPPAAARRRQPRLPPPRPCYQVLDDSQAQGQQSVKSKVQAKCCFALETFCENLGDEIVPFLEPLMARCDKTRVSDTALRASQLLTTSLPLRLCALLRAARGHAGDLRLGDRSVALASEARFTPYFAPTYN